MTPLRELSYARSAISGDVSVDPNSRKASVEYRVELGPRYTFGTVTVAGHEDLPAEAIWGAADVQYGAPFRPSTLEDAKRAIYELGPFASVDIVEQPRTDGSVVDSVNDHGSAALSTRCGLASRSR